jgi:hypothetical protein
MCLSQLPLSFSTHNLKPTLKPTASRKSSRPKKAAKIDYQSLNNGIPSLPSVSWPDRFAEYERQGRINVGGYGEMEAEDVGVKEWIVRMGGCDEGWETDDVGPLGRPTVVRGKMPDRALSVQDIAKMNGQSSLPSLARVRFVPDSLQVNISSNALLLPYTITGHDTPVEVVDVANQGSSKTVPGTNDPWTLGSWADYYSTPSEAKSRIFNIISYEISGTKLAKQVQPPKIVS